jgi:repressor LexA
VLSLQPLTARQQQAFDCITHSLDERGYPPTLQEIGTAMGIHSTNGVRDHLKALERKGYLVREGVKSRALRPAFTDRSATLRVFGQDAPVKIERLLFGAGANVLAVIAKDDAMLLAGVRDGEPIFVSTSRSAVEGDLVVVMNESGPMCQRLSSDQLAPIIGVVIGAYLRLS